MELSHRTDYACRLIRGVYNAHGQCVSVSDLSEDENIPYSFARIIQRDLVKAGIFKSQRGSKGGVTLACDLNTTTLYDVLIALDGFVCFSGCSHDGGVCPNSCHCEFRKIWVGADKLVKDYFESITLHDILESD